MLPNTILDPSIKLASLILLFLRLKSSNPFPVQLTSMFQDSKTKNWRLGSDDIHLFVEELEPHVRELYPDVKKIMMANYFVRGGSLTLDQPM